MKTASSTIIDHVQQATAVHSATRVIVEWNQNRYGTISAITNGSSADYDPNLFPISSIAEPVRPNSSGIVKARASSTSRTSAIGAESYVSRSYKDNSSGVKYVVPSADSKYKYWTSPSQSAGGPSGTPAAISNCAPQIVYTDFIWTNKVVVVFENSYAAPASYTIDVSTDGIGWTTVASNVSLDADGRVVIYRQADGNWSTTVHRESPLQLKGVRVTVTQMNKSGVFFNLIELSPRLESDISTFVKDWSTGMDMSEHSFVMPFGTISANSASVTLSNIDARFTNDNSSSLYYGLLAKGAVVTIDVGISVDPYDTVSKSYEWVRIGTFKSEEWTGQDREGTTIELKDDSEILQTTKPNPVFYQQVTVGEIIWKLLDSVGYTNYKYEKVDIDIATLIPYFWTDGESTLWEVIGRLAQATQTAVYFDEYGVLQIKTKSTAYDMAKTAVWQLDAVLNSPKLPDIITSQKSYEYEANTVNVNYKATTISDDSRGVPAMESVWEPEGDLALRASALQVAINSTQNWMKIFPSDAKLWPYSSVVQVEGEFIRYNGKQYRYYQTNGVTAMKYIKSEDEKKDLDRLYPRLAFANTFTGYLSIAERGVWSSVGKSHTVDASGYTRRYRHKNGSMITWEGGWQRQLTGTLKMATNSNFATTSWYVGKRSTGLSSTPRFYGTRLRFPTSGGYAHGIAGMVMSPGTNDSGFYIELVSTKILTADALARTYELCFYVRKNDGTITRIGPASGRGVRLEVIPAQWYDLEVTLKTVGSTSTFNIMVNGVNRMSVNVPSSSYPPDGLNTSAGIFTRGFTHAEFEYLFASNSSEVPESDEATVFDRITGGYQSNQMVKELGYTIRGDHRFGSVKSIPAANDIYTKMFYDEFGPVVHEVREFDVKFSKTPVLHSRLYFSNESQVVCPEYNSNAFGAKFILANAYRRNAVLNGDDALTFGINNVVNQRTLIYGRTVTQADEKTVTVKDEAGIRKNGESSIDIGNEWVQTEAAAKAIGDWIVLHWGTGADQLSVECFGNPFLQLGDVVSVNDPLNNMAPTTHKYFIVEISHTYEAGLRTSLILRRAKI